MREKQEKWLLLILGILNPIFYFINPYIFLLSIILELYVVYKNGKTISDKVWKTYFLASLYFGVSILKLKVYDLIIILFIPLVILKKTYKFTKSKYNHILIMIMYSIYLAIILVFKDNTIGAMSEFSRYLVGFMTIAMLYQTVGNTYDLRGLVEFIPILAIKNILNGIFVWILINYFNMQKNFSF